MDDADVSATTQEIIGRTLNQDGAGDSQAHVQDVIGKSEAGYCGEGCEDDIGARSMQHRAESEHRGAEGASSTIQEANPLSRITAAILLCGGVRPTKLSSSIGRSILELPIESNRTLLDDWHDQMKDLARLVDRKGLPVRAIMGGEGEIPAAPVSTGEVVFTVERDPNTFRGTGGVLHDISRGYPEDEYLLVANGAQLLMRPLDELVESLGRCGGDVSVVAHRDGTPSGLMLVRCGVMRDVSVNGFVDMKEQALPEIARLHDVRVVFYDEPTGLPVRTLGDYVQAVRLHHLRLANKPAVANPFAEAFESTFTLIEDGATVDESAVLTDAVVLRDAEIGRRSVVVRSLVCPKGRVRPDGRVVDRVVVPVMRRDSGSGS